MRLLFSTLSILLCLCFRPGGCLDGTKTLGPGRRHRGTKKDRKSSASAVDKTSDWNAGWSQRDTRGTSSSGQADDTNMREETREVPANHAGGIMAIAEDLEQQEGEPQPDVQEKH